MLAILSQFNSSPIILFAFSHIFRYSFFCSNNRSASTSLSAKACTGLPSDRYSNTANYDPPHLL